MLYWYFRLSMLLNMAVISNFLLFMSKEVSNTHTKFWIFIFADWQQLLNVSWISIMCLYKKKNKTFWCIFIQLQCWRALQESKLDLHVAYCINTTERHIYAKNGTQFNQATITWLQYIKHAYVQYVMKHTFTKIVSTPVQLRNQKICPCSNESTI